MYSRMLLCVLLGYSITVRAAETDRKPNSSIHPSTVRIEPKRPGELQEFETVPEMVPKAEGGPFLVLISGADRCVVSTDVARAAGFSLGEIANLLVQNGVAINCKGKTGIAKAITVSFAR